MDNTKCDIFWDTVYSDMEPNKLTAEILYAFLRLTSNHYEMSYLQRLLGSPLVR